MYFKILTYNVYVKRSEKRGKIGLTQCRNAIMKGVPEK